MKNLELVSKVYNTLLNNIDEEIQKVAEELVNSDRGNELKRQVEHIYYELERQEGNTKMKNKYPHDIKIKVVEGIVFKNNIELYKALKSIDSKVSWKGFTREIMPLVADRIINSIDE